MSQNATSYKEPTPRQLRRLEWQAKRTAELAEEYRKRVSRLSKAVREALQCTTQPGVLYAYDEQHLKIFLAIETGTPLDHQPETQRLVVDAIAQAVGDGKVCALKSKHDGMVAYHLPVEELLTLSGSRRKFMTTVVPKKAKPIEWTVTLANGTFVTNIQGVAEQYLHGAPSRKQALQVDDNHNLRVRISLPHSLVAEWYS